MTAISLRRSALGTFRTSRADLRHFRGILLGSLGLVLVFAANASATSRVAGQHKPATQNRANSDYFGMYTFLHDGEFVQITQEDQGKISGFVARYGELESDRGVRLDHFFKNATIDGDRLMFTTEVVHGISYTFHGSFSKEVGKKPGEEGYIGIEGKLIETGANDKDMVTSREREITLKSLARKTESSGNPAR